MAGIHRRAVSVERMTDLELDRPVGSWRAYVTGRIGRYKLDALPRLGETQADVQVLTPGGQPPGRSQPVVGAALSLGRYNNDASGASLDSTAVIGSLHGTWRRGGLYVSGALSGGSTSVDVKRSITLGPAVRAEQGSTSAGQFGVELDAGWILGEPDDLQHGPFLGLAWLDQTVDGYRESGSFSTSMNFSASTAIPSSRVRATASRCPWPGTTWGFVPMPTSPMRRNQGRSHFGDRGLQYHARTLHPFRLHAAAPLGEHRPGSCREPV